MYINARIENETLTALVDTGASGLAFISESFSQHLKLSCEKIAKPISLTGFEGKEGPVITHQVTFLLKIGNHSETMSAYITNPCKYDLILGLPWLEKHNPFVDWREHTLTFGELCLEEGCCKFETTIPYVNSQSPASKIVPLSPISHISLLIITITRSFNPQDAPQHQSS